MKLLFKMALVMLITSHSVKAQKEIVYSKTFETDKETTMIINLENSSVSIKPSLDGKVHIYYTLEFENYSKKDIKDKLNDITVQATKFANNITLMSSSGTKISRMNYAFNESISIDDNFFKLKDSLKTVTRKSKDSIIREIRSSFGSKGPFFSNNKFKIRGEDGKLINLKKNNVKIIRSSHVIKVPPYVRLNINGKESQITLKEDIANELKLNLKRGFLKAGVLRNTYNQIKLDNASFNAVKLQGGDYILNNVSKGLIGSITDIKLTSEFSKMEIGEIDKESTITDFNSTFWFYNFSEDFKRFDFYSEYSKIHFFYPELDHSLKVFGHNTVNHIGGMKIEMQPNEKDEKFNMMERKPNGKRPFSGHINFDIVHGIIYSYDDSIVKINRDQTSKNNN